ncbi:S8 family serine peptidase, partial [Kaarinaea lacus]
DIETGSSNPVLVAVLDSGIDFNHQDLQSNIWRNPNEVANNGIDDDGNGFVDDINGWDFVNNDNNPQDDLNHGTHVSGTIAAVGNNGIGVTGVSWTAQILPVKFLNRFGQGSTANAIRALNYAVALGARVSNLSYGGTAFSQALYDTIAAANNAGHIVVAAAGNSSNNSDNFPIYPAAYNLPNIISVAATGANDQLANFSNFGAVTVDLAAPGVNTLSTVPFNNYATMNGTSMSTPHVTGVVSLLLAKQPGLTPADVKSALLSTVDLLPSLAGRTVSGGRVNAFQALSTLAPQIAVTTVNGVMEFAVSETAALVASGGTAPYVWSSSNPSVAVIDTTGHFTALAPGVVQITATDSNNNTGTSAAITVTQMTVTPNSGSVGVGQSLRFSASGGVAPYAYSVNNPTVASINAITGELTALAVGTTTVNVIDNAGNSVSSSTITVSDISLTPQTGLIGVSDSLQFNAAGGVPPFTWSSSSPAIAGIAANGLLSGLAAGTTTVTVTDSLGMTVNSGPVEVRAVSVAPQSGTLLIGDSLQLSTSGGNPPYTWSVSDTTIATIDANGLLTASAVGTITASVTDADGFATTTGSITITDVVVTIDVSPAIASVNRFNWVLFSAIGGTGPYTFSLSNPAAGTINATTGWFRATGAIGETTSIIATDANGDQGESGIVSINGFGHH